MNNTFSTPSRGRLVHIMVFLWCASFTWSVHAQSGSPQKASKAAPKRVQKSVNPAKKALSLPQTEKARKALFEKGNTLYNKGHFAKAAQTFRALTHNPKWTNFSVLYNLGNCYFRLQQYGVALAFYRKAQRHRPNDLDLLHNIQLLYQRVGKNEQTIPQLRLKFLFWYYLLSLKQLFFLVIFMTSVGLLLGAIYIRRSAVHGRFGLRWYAAVWMTIVVMLWISLGIKVYQEELRQVGVIKQDRITARSGYGAQFEPLFRLSQADEVLIRERVRVQTASKQVNEWVRIEIYLYDKQQKRRIRQVGWIPSRTLEEI